MSPRLAIMLLLPLCLAISACQSPVNDVASASSQSPDGPALETVEIPADPDPALWVLKDDDTTIYIFGTVHILKPGLTWFDEAVKDAFDASDELVVEMIEPDPSEMVAIVGELAIDKTGISLRDKLERHDREKYEAAMTSLGLPVNQFDPLEPWFASVSMSLIPLMQSGYDTNSGVEDDLTSLAKSRNMKIIGLETARQQLGFFDNLPEDVQIRFLNFNVESIGDMAVGMENMVAYWATGNVDALSELMNAGLEEEILYEILLINRNAAWAEWVEERMEKPGTVFLAVGAGHLAGKGSVQDQLKSKGLVTSQIEY